MGIMHFSSLFPSLYQRGWLFSYNLNYVPRVATAQFLWAIVGGCYSIQS